MNLLDQLAETRIQEAIERGDLRDLPGAGQPLILADDSAISEVLRAAYRLLKNAGFLPPELHNCARKSVKPSSACSSYRQANAAARAPVWSYCNYVWLPPVANPAICCWKTSIGSAC